jgi:hypothetical protein
MSDETIAAIARELAGAMQMRAKSRSPEDMRRVLELQADLCTEVHNETRQAVRAALRNEIHELIIQS